MIKSEMPGATWLVETLWHSSGVLDIEYVWQELLPFIWTYIQELQQGAAAWSTFGNKRLQDDGFLPVMDIYQHHESSCKRYLQTPNLVWRRWRVWFTSIVRTKVVGTGPQTLKNTFNWQLSLPERCCAGNLFRKFIKGKPDLSETLFQGRMNQFRRSPRCCFAWSLCHPHRMFSHHPSTRCVFNGERICCDMVSVHWI